MGLTKRSRSPLAAASAAAPLPPADGDLIPIDLEGWGAPTIARDWQLYRRRLTFGEAIDLANELARVLGSQVAGLLLSGAGRVSSEAILAASAEAIAAEGWDDWLRYLFGAGAGKLPPPKPTEVKRPSPAVLWAAPAGGGGEAVPVMLGDGPEGDTRDMVFGEAPLEVLGVAGALIKEGVGPFPGFARPPAPGGSGAAGG